MPKTAKRPAVDARYTADMQAEDRALVGRSWRCLVHGRLGFDQALYLSDFAYCGIDDCTEQLIGIGKSVGACDPSMSAWSKDFKPAKKRNAARSTTSPSREGSDSDVEWTEGLEASVVLDEPPETVDQVLEEEPEAGPPGDDVEASEQADPDTDVDQVDAEPQELVQQKEEPMVMKKATAYARGALKEKMLALLAAAPGKAMPYAELAEALWPGVERRVQLSRLSVAGQKAMRQGFVKAADGVVTLLIDRPPPPSMQAPARPQKPRRKAARKPDAEPVATYRAGSPRSTNDHVQQLRAAIHAKIGKLQEVLVHLDHLDEVLA